MSNIITWCDLRPSKDCLCYISDATDCRRQDTTNELEECSGFKDFYAALNSRAVEHEILKMHEVEFDFYTIKYVQ